MKRTLTIGVLLSAAIPAFAQTQAPPPAKVIQIYREQVKPGKAVAHEKVEVGWPAAFAKASSPAYYVAMTSVSGPGEAWYINPRDSFAALGKDDEAVEKNPALKAQLDALSAQDGELLSGISIYLATYREDLSYRPDIEWSKARLVNVTTFRINMGRDQDFVAWRKIVNDAHAKANMNESWVVYQVTSGAPGGTFLLFAPLKSMADLDALADMHGKSYQDAVGEDNRTRIRDLQHETLQSVSSQVFAMSPKMSYVSKEFASGDPDFWTPKPPAPAKVPAKAEAKQ